VTAQRSLRSADGALAPGHRRHLTRRQSPFRHRYGRVQSTIDGIIRATNVLRAGNASVRRRLRLGSDAASSYVHGGWVARDHTEVESDAGTQANRTATGHCPGAARPSLGEIFCTATGAKSVHPQGAHPA